MKKEITNIFINSSIAERIEDNNRLYSIRFDTQPIIIKNNANLKVANICHTGLGQGNNIFNFKLEGIMTDYNKYLTNDGGTPTIISTTFNNTRNYTEENDIPIINQTINSIKINLSTLNGVLYTFNNSYTIITSSANNYVNHILYFSDDDGNSIISKVMQTTGTPQGFLVELSTVSYSPYFTSIPKLTNFVNGSGAILNATITSGVITGITITNGGGGYNNNQLLIIKGGGGSGCIAHISGVNLGLITAITVKTGGSNYTSQPTIEFQPYLAVNNMASTVINPNMTATFGTSTEGIPKTLNFCISLKIEEEINE